MRRYAFLALVPLLGAQDPSWSEESSLFWPQSKRDLAYRNIEKVYSHRVVKAGARPHRFGAAAALRIDVNIDAYIASQHIAGLIIVHRNRIVLERYARGYNAEGRWLSQSVAKSVTSLLVGAVIQDKLIASVDDPVVKYLPDMKGSAYDGVTLRHLLTMTSGAKWNEDYTDLNSDTAQFGRQEPEPGLDLVVSIMRKLPREAPPGTKWAYKTGETHLIGALLRRVTGQPLADYLSAKIWKPYGMERDAIWQTMKTGGEFSGCCMAISLRDYARIGQFILDGGKANGRQVIDPAHLKSATSKQAGIGIPGRGYGYQWWTLDDGSFHASGIFGQSLFIDPRRQLVVATSGNWPTAVDREILQPARFAFWRQIQNQVQAAAEPAPR
jgi:CubicO group peptidase (beta-lactamase class C family)